MFCIGELHFEKRNSRIVIRLDARAEVRSISKHAGALVHLSIFNENLKYFEYRIKIGFHMKKSK